MQEIVLCLCCDYYVRMLSCKEIWKSRVWLCWMFLWDACDWDKVMFYGVETGACSGALQGFSIRLPYAGPGRCSPVSGLLLCSLIPHPSPPHDLRIACELALCPVHYIQVQLLVTAWSQLCDLWESPYDSGRVHFCCGLCLSPSGCCPLGFELYRASDQHRTLMILLQPAS